MKVHLTGPASGTRSSLLQCLQKHGYTVSESDSAAAEADLYLFTAGHEAMKHLAQGLVVLDLRGDPELRNRAWAPYADLCLVPDTATRDKLVATGDFEPERIVAAPDDEALVGLLDQAVRDALPQAAERPDSRRARARVVGDKAWADRNRCRAEGVRGAATMTQLPSRDEASLMAAQEIAALSARMEASRGRADVMLRGYQVRSKLPLVGSLIAWVRRNLTSHLREPYLDPTLERQVALNRDLLEIVREMLRLHIDLEARLARLEEERGHDRKETADH